MRETLLFAPGASGAELLRSLAGSGVNTIGYRIVGAAELARIALMKSGIAVTDRFLPRKEEPAVIDSFLRGIPYFSSASYADSESLAASLYTLRALIPVNEEAVLREKLPEGEFPEKNGAILEAYGQYRKTLEETGGIDTVGLIRKALEEAEPLDADILTLKEYPLAPLERKLAEKLSGGKVTETSLIRLFRAEPKPLRNVRFTECYGASNEVRDIISFIFRSGIPLDHCTVAVAETLRYAELFHDISTEYDIPMSFGCGLPITVSDPARLLKLYHAWNTSGYHGIDALDELIMSSAFDREKLQGLLPGGKPVGRDAWKELIRAAGSLRLSSDASENRRKLAGYESLLPSSGAADAAQGRVIPESLRILTAEMEKGPAYLIRTYSRIREGRAGRIDRSAVTVITEMIDAYTQFSGNSEIGEIIPAILQKTVASENSREGHLHICGIPGAMAVPRDYLFIAGLSAAHFPGSPTENYLLLDSDLLLFGEEPQVPTSAARILRKKETLSDLLHLASALDLQVRLSYSSYDLAELKEMNPSSVLHEIFEEAYPGETSDEAFEQAFRHVSFFHDRISRHSDVGAAYINGNRIVPESIPGEADPDASADPAYPWSPSAIDVFFSCPRRFYLTRILRIEEPESDDPFEVIHASDEGNLAHELMERLGMEHPDRYAFLSMAEAAFDRYLLTRPPVNPNDGIRQKQRFLRMMRNAWDMDPGREIALSEEKLTMRHPSGVTLRGIPDRVEKREDGRYLIVDFKTGRRLRHTEDDIATCLQVLIYAWMMEQSGLDIAGCEYRYVRSRNTVTCRYDEDMKAQLDRRLEEFRDALLAGNFPCAASRDNCRYCALGSVCGKDKPEEEEEEDDE